MTRRAPRSTRTATRFPYTTLFRSVIGIVARVEQAADESGRRAAEHADRRHDRRHRERFQYIDDSFGRAIAPLAVVAGKGGDRALDILGAEIDEHQQCRPDVQSVGERRGERALEERKWTSLKPVTNANLVCRHSHEKIKKN